MKKLIILAVFLYATFSTFAQQPLKDFESLMEVLKSGKSVSVVIHYGKCQLISDNEISEKSPEAIGGMTIDVFEYFAAGAVYNKQAFVVASTSKLIQNPIGEGFVYNYVKIRIDEDGQVKITAKYLDPINFEEKMTENFFSTISDGSNDGAVEFFSN